MTLPTHLECAWCGDRVDAASLHATCPRDDRTYLARYDLEALGERVDPASLRGGRPDLWRFADLLPLQDERNLVTLGEGATPLLEAPRLAHELGLRDVRLKDEGGNPTGTFKARGMAVAVSAALERGAEALAVPTAGNAGAALAAYAARAGVTARVVAPEDSAPAVFEAGEAYGVPVEKVEGLISDAGARVANLVASKPGWFSVATLREPYRLEGKKTMGYEVLLDLDLEVPDVLVYPTGGGTGLIGIWKALDEMEQLGWIGSERPRLVAVQSEGCAPMVRAFHDGAKTAEAWEDPETVARGLRVPGAVGDHLILRALRETEGTAVAVPDDAILDARRDLARWEGVDACTEAAATVAGLEALVTDGWVDASERVVCLLTGAGWTG